MYKVRRIIAQPWFIQTSASLTIKINWIANYRKRLDRWIFPETVQLSYKVNIWWIKGTSQREGKVFHQFCFLQYRDRVTIILLVVWEVQCRLLRWKASFKYTDYRCSIIPLKLSIYKVLLKTFRFRTDLNYMQILDHEDRHVDRLPANETIMMAELLA